MIATVVEVADAVRALLAGQTFGQPVNVRRSAAPVFAASALSVAQICVVPWSQAMEIVTRGSDQWKPQIDVGVAKRVDVVNEEPKVADVDALLLLVQDVADALMRIPLANASFVGLETVVLCDPKQLLETHVFNSVLRVTYQVHRARTS